VRLVAPEDETGVAPGAETMGDELFA